MSTLTIRKNFNFDKELIDKVGTVLQQHNKNFTEVLTNYFKAVVKEPNLIEAMEKKAKQRTGNFIGMLDGKIGDMNHKQMKSNYSEHIS